MGLAAPAWDPFNKPRLVAAPSRVVRNLTGRDEDDEPADNPTQPSIPPLLAADAHGVLRVTRLPKREKQMPKGVYVRKAKVTPDHDVAAQPKKRGRKARNVALVPEVAARSLNGSKGRFDVSVDLRGGAVTINAQSGSLTLAPDEVLALFAFLGRR